jgi:phospholipase C
MTYNHNDFHPPFGRLRESDVSGVEVIDSAVSDVRAGEALVHEIYEAIKRSARPDGSNAMNTMLLITFDEHGGTYDHVAPPPATRRTTTHWARWASGSTGSDAACRRSPYRPTRAAGTIIHDEMHHAAVIATLSGCTD